MARATSTDEQVLEFCDRTINDPATHALFGYTEGPTRWDWANRPPSALFTGPIDTDCSGYATIADWITTPQVPDPSKLGYRGGFTGTFLASLPQIGHPADVLDGDYVVLGPDSGDHMAIVRDTSSRDFRCASHGHPGAPEWVTVSAMAETISPIVRYLRNDVSSGPPPLTKGSPAWQLAQQGHHAPMGVPPALTPGSTHHAFDVLARRVLRLYGLWGQHEWLAPRAGWGPKSIAACRTWQENWNANPLHAMQQFAPDGAVTPRIWAAWGFTW